MKLKIAYFISPHGFGHAARSAAILESLNHLNKKIEFEIFTSVGATANASFGGSGSVTYTGTVSLADVQLERSDYATTFDRLSPSDSLAAAQR